MNNHKTVFCVISISLLIIVSVIVVSATNASATHSVDENGKLIGDTIEYNSDENTSIMSREEKIRRLQEEKNSFDIIENNSGTNEVQTLSSEDRSAFEEAEKLARQQNDYTKSIFSDGIKIINKYSNVKYHDTINSPESVTRDLLAVMVNTINNNKLTTDEEAKLKMCIADMFVIITPEDSLYSQIEILLKELPINQLR